MRQARFLRLTGLALLGSIGDVSSSGNGVCSSIGSFSPAEEASIADFVDTRRFLLEVESFFRESHVDKVNSTLDLEEIELELARNSHELCMRQVEDVFFKQPLTLEERIQQACDPLRTEGKAEEALLCRNNLLNQELRNQGKEMTKCFDELEAKGKEAKRKSEVLISAEKERLGQNLESLKTDYEEARADLVQSMEESKAIRCADHIELEERLTQREQEKRMSIDDIMQMISKLEMVFDDPVCCDIDNASRLFERDEAEGCAVIIEQSMNFAFWAMGLDLRMSNTYLQKQTFLPYILSNSTSNSTSRRRLGAYNGDGGTTSTTFYGNYGCSRCGGDTRCDCNRRRSLSTDISTTTSHCGGVEEEVSATGNTLHRQMESSQDNSVAIYMEQLSDNVEQFINVMHSDFIAEGYERVNASCRICGPWSVEDEINKLNPDMLRNWVDFAEACDLVAAKRDEEREIFAEKVLFRRSKFVEYYDTHESTYDTCITQMDQGTCLEEYDNARADSLENYFSDINQDKELHIMKFVDLKEILSRLQINLDTNLAALVLINPEDAEKETKFKEERQRQLAATSDIETDLNELVGTTTESLCCTIDGLNRPFFEAEKQVIESVLHRSLNYELIRGNKCFVATSPSFKAQNWANQASQRMMRGLQDGRGLVSTDLNKVQMEIHRSTVRANDTACDLNDSDLCSMVPTLEELISLELKDALRDGTQKVSVCCSVGSQCPEDLSCCMEQPTPKPTVIPVTPLVIDTVPTGWTRITSRWEENSSYLGRHGDAREGGGWNPSTRPGLFVLDENSEGWGMMFWRLEDAGNDYPGKYRIINNWDGETGYLTRDSYWNGDESRYDPTNTISFYSLHEDWRSQVWQVESAGNGWWRLINDWDPDTGYLTRHGESTDGDITFDPTDEAELNARMDDWDSEFWRFAEDPLPW